MAVDLDKARAARREAKGAGPEIIFGGITYELQPELPFGVLEGMRQMAAGEEHGPGALVSIAEALLGEHYEAWKATQPSIDDLNDLIGGVMEEYGIEAPLDSSTS